MSVLTDNTTLNLTDENTQVLTDGTEVPSNSFGFSLPQHSLSEVVVRMVSY